MQNPQPSSLDKMRKRRGFRQGVYNPINKSKYVALRTPVYRSSWELKFFQWCDNNPNVLEWTSESIAIPYISPLDNRVHRYFADNKVVLREGDKITKYLVEIKPKKQTKPPIVKNSRKKQSTILYEKSMYIVNQAKWDAARQWCKKQGYQFLIVTEDDLFHPKGKRRSKS